MNSKLEKGNTMVTKTDNGKTCVIIYTDEYSKKVHNFLNEREERKPTSCNNIDDLLSIVDVDY